MRTRKENIIKKLFQQEQPLSPEERTELNRDRHVDRALHQLWEETPKEIFDQQKADRIWTGVQKKIHQPRPLYARRFLYQYGAAAMLALCMVLSTLLFTRNIEKEIIYVMNTGHQSMDSVTLADGTKVMLNAGSQLIYPQTFSGARREVQLSGQAFFQVSPDKKHPFVVKTKKMDVTALGTSFEVFSYDEDVEAETILLTGKIKVELPAEVPSSQAYYILHPNEKLAYHKTEGVSLTATDANTYSSWRKGKRISFKNETLEMILKRLEKWYGQKIACDPQVARHYRFTFTIHSEPLDLILSYISHSAPLNYKLISNEHYVIEEIK